MPVLHLTFTVPGIMSNASLWSSFSWDVGGWTFGTWETLLCCCSWMCSRIVCCLSNRVNNLLISLVCAFISLACQRSKCTKTNTCVQWAISSSTISTSKASWPLRPWASAESWRCEALLWAVLPVTPELLWHSAPFLPQYCCGIVLARHWNVWGSSLHFGVHADL